MYIEIMAKKCIPGVICIENMTLFLIVIIIILIYFVWFQSRPTLGDKLQGSPSHIHIQNLQSPDDPMGGNVDRCSMVPGSTRGDPLTNAYVPPITCDSGGLFNPAMPVMTTNIASLSRIPINIRTQNYETQYSQIGILTKQVGNVNEILPLMGRRTNTSRDKWQYYTISGGGGGGIYKQSYLCA